MRISRDVTGVICGTAAAFLLGCGGGGSGPPVPLDQLALQYTTLFCHKAFICCDAAELASSEATSFDELACRSLLGEPIFSSIENDTASVSEGRLVYHGQSARRCLDALAALPCSQWGGDEELFRRSDCLQVFEGTVAPGASCSRDPECANGFCDNGRCVAFAKLGESCVGVSCATGLHCATDSAGLPTVCADPLPDGGVCMYDNDCESAFCNIDATLNVAVCGPPTFCNGV